MVAGSYDEPATVAALEAFATENGYVIDIGNTRWHHEIYLSDPRKVTHTPELARRSDRYLVMSDGRIVEDTYLNPKGP